MPVILPVSSDLILDNNKGICSSGKVVFGAKVALFDGVPVTGADAWLPFEWPSRPGRAGTAKVGPDDVLAAGGAATFSSEMEETYVNGSIDAGESNVRGGN